MSRYNDHTGLWGCGLVILLVIGALVFGVVKLSTDRVETITVKDKERVCSGSSSCQYLVWDTDGEVYENTDTILAGKFDSSTLYGALEEDHTYKVKVNGWRIPLFSWYPNIVSIESEITK
ncbi:DUF1523 family protein [Nonomuraea angiospora]|uniref:DUF1523 family protein n=1 Tax=Nonomuraea angiospora TaxID=46172 RepID=UPI0034112600